MYKNLKALIINLVHILWCVCVCVCVCVQAEILQHQVVICTCHTAGILLTRGLLRGDFSHIIFDEASQAMEPEVMLGLRFADENTHVVLAGDPKQLGASVRSPLAAKRGLGISLQERLMKQEPYLSDNSIYITKLVFNYRSHGSIIEV